MEDTIFRYILPYVGKIRIDVQDNSLLNKDSNRKRACYFSIENSTNKTSVSIVLATTAVFMTSPDYKKQERRIMSAIEM